MLSPRLAGIAELISGCHRLIDIGTDHAYLPIAMIRQGRCKAALAADLRSGPLERASMHIRQAELTEKISLCQSNGLDQITLQADDVVVIAGLGGLEMIDILARALCMPFARDIKFVLQPMKSTYVLRQWLSENQMQIEKEALIIEKRYDYPVIRTSYHEEAKPLSSLECWLGPDLMREKPEGFPLYLRRQYQQLEKRCQGQPELRPALADMKNYLIRRESDSTSKDL